MALTYFFKSITSGVTVTSGWDLGTTGWRTQHLCVPALTSNTTVTLYVSDVDAAAGTTATTGYYLYKGLNRCTSVVQLQTYEVPNTAAACIYEMPTGYRYLKLKIQSTQTDSTATFKIIVSD